jgi:hypothetical protein
MKRTLHGLICDFIVWYLKRCGGAFHFNPYGRHDAGYIVKMNETEYQSFTCLAQGRTPKDLHTIIWASRDAGVWVP